jgi:ribosomal protein S4
LYMSQRRAWRKEQWSVLKLSNQKINFRSLSRLTTAEARRASWVEVWLYGRAALNTIFRHIHRPRKSPTKYKSSIPLQIFRKVYTGDRIKRFQRGKRRRNRTIKFRKELFMSAYGVWCIKTFSKYIRKARQIRPKRHNAFSRQVKPLLNRLDITLLALGLAKNIKRSRQAIGQKLVAVNSVIVTKPHMLISVTDVITLDRNYWRVYERTFVSKLRRDQPARAKSIIALQPTTTKSLVFRPILRCVPVDEMRFRRLTKNTFVSTFDLINRVHSAKN